MDSKNKDGAVIVEENQCFVFEKLALANGHSYLNSSIKKFGCFVTRNTLNLRYFFGPENKKRSTSVLLFLYKTTVVWYNILSFGYS